MNGWRLSDLAHDGNNLVRVHGIYLLNDAAWPVDLN